MSADPVYLSSFGHAFGEPVPLAELDDPGVHALLTELTDEGLKYCCVSTSSVTELAAASSRATLAGQEPVDAIVFCTDTSPELTPTSEVWDLLLALDLPRTPITFVGGAGCGNIGPGLSAARALILVEGASRVLLVTSDRQQQRTRYLDNGRTVMSDGAGSCLVTATPTGPGFAVRGLSNSFRADIGTVTERRISVARATAQAIEDTVRRLTGPLSLTARDFRYLLMGNYGHTAQEFLAMSAGLPTRRVYCPMLDRTGHCFAADVLVSLGDLVATRDVADGDRVLLLTASPRSWSAVALTYASAN